MGAPPPTDEDNTRSVRRQQKRQLEVVSARSAVATFDAAAWPDQLVLRQRHTSTLGLPMDILQLVMKQLAVPDLVRGAGAVLRDLGSARMACWELHEASQCGVPCLVAALPPLPASSAEFWDALLHKPMSFTVAELKQAARSLNAAVSGTKPELILRILHSFGLEQPSAVPAALCMALYKERTAPLHPCVVARLRDMAWRGHLLAADALRQADAACMRRIVHAFVHGGVYSSGQPCKVRNAKYSRTPVSNALLNKFWDSEAEDTATGFGFFLMAEDALFASIGGTHAVATLVLDFVGTPSDLSRSELEDVAAHLLEHATVRVDAAAAAAGTAGRTPSAPGE
ncbi:hypothetical protein OEZ85_011058 [Tetradesmus obliquus]|uniref:SAP domain-containing protein n=1 Tax=Tetradesmus obliquus TaxID=3088 RepID=A0ABY8TRA8_TETOB|nr:hypothetical protein OEZ85_011058 [Tetradesmus obliquus]